MAISNSPLTSTTDLGRRNVLASATALGLSAALGARPAFAQSNPKKGGTLRLGMDGGSASDSLDPRTYTASIMIFTSRMVWNALVEIDHKGNAMPELAESWESKPGATDWVFNIRRGIAFGSGKLLDADDVIYSINLHRGDTKSPLKNILQPIKELKKLSESQVQVVLSSGNADLPFAFADYHLIIVPAGTVDFSKADGTGAFSLTAFNPGVSVLAKRKSGNYWKPNRGNFDSVEILYINDASTRTQALVTGRVDAINRVDPKTATPLSKNTAISVVRTRGAGNRYCFAAMTDRDPFNNRDLMLALKFGIDRKKIVDNVFSGFAVLGNDHTIGPLAKYYDASQLQRPFDLDKAAFHFKKAGFQGAIELNVSEGAYNGATDSAVVFQEGIKKAGVNIAIRRVSGDGYFSNVWNKVPFCAVYWGNRPTADLQLTTTYMSGQTWNDTKYSNPKFDKLIVDARIELNESKRAMMYAECQSLLSEEAGTLCFAVADQMDACSARVRGLEPHPSFDMSDNRLAEVGWFA
jgi:peptide/nickel transport system substrate-binding protein